MDANAVMGVKLGYFPLREELGLGVLENRVLRVIFRTKGLK
jgi:hypothetical protein